MARQLTQSKAIMIAIEYCGDIKPGQRCSAIFFDHADVQRERTFYERFCRSNGMQDDAQVAAMVAAHVPARPYWLVSIKPAEETSVEEVRYQKVDDRLGQVLPEILT